jgi:hypothetical protein
MWVVAPLTDGGDVRGLGGGEEEWSSRDAARRRGRGGAATATGASANVVTSVVCHRAINHVTFGEGIWVMACALTRSP